MHVPSCQFVAAAVSPLYRITFVQNIPYQSVINKGLANVVHYIVQSWYYTSSHHWGGKPNRPKSFQNPLVLSELSTGPQCSDPFHLGSLCRTGHGTVTQSHSELWPQLIAPGLLEITILQYRVPSAAASQALSLQVACLAAAGKWGAAEGWGALHCSPAPGAGTAFGPQPCRRDVVCFSSLPFRAAWSILKSICTDLCLKKQESWSLWPRAHGAGEQIFVKTKKKWVSLSVWPSYLTNGKFVTWSCVRLYTNYSLFTDKLKPE